ncbi:MAG: AI-2E family transporter [Nitratireductor sp.]
MDAKTEKLIRQQVFFWLVALAAFGFLLWLFNDILLPFLAGMVLAYFLDPVADLLERWGFSRLMATTTITFSFLVLFILALIIVIPILGGQVTGFAQRVPELVTRLQELIATSDSTWLRDNVGIDSKTIKDNLSELVTKGAGFLSKFISGVWSSGLALVNIVSLLVVTPVVAFYLLFDWDKMVAKVDSWIPRDDRQTVRQIFKDIDKAVAGFIRGQGSLCLVLGLFYGVSLTIAGLNFGLLIGLFAGLISFIPYVGSLLGLVIALGVALVQFWPDYFGIGIIAAIFVVGQFLEGNILQPKMVGKSIGLHPVWLMFALFAFGTLFGFTGLLIAVPASAAVAVLVRFALGKYLQSEVYLGQAKAKSKSASKRVAKSKK